MNTYYPYFAMDLNNHTFHFLCLTELLSLEDEPQISIIKDNICYFPLPLDNEGREMDYEYLNNEIKEITFDESFLNCKPTSISFWFNNLYNLEKINNLQYLDTSEVTNFVKAFDGCKKLKELDLSHFKTDKVTNLSYAFSNCSSLQTLDLSSFSNASVTWRQDYSYFDNGFDNMFCNDVKLQTIYVSNKWINNDNEVFKKSGWLFHNCPRLVGECGTKSIDEEFDAYLAKIDEKDSPGLFTLKKED